MSPWFHGSLGVFLFISLACGGGAPLQISNDLPPQPKKEEPPPTPEVEMEVLILFGSRKKEDPPRTKSVFGMVNMQSNSMCTFWVRKRTRADLWHLWV